MWEMREKYGVSKEEVRAAFRMMKCGKAVGPDYLSVKMFVQ